MVFDIYSDHILLLAFWIAAAIIGLALLIFLLVFFMHLRVIARDKQVERLEEAWAPLIKQCTQGLPATIPTVSKGEAVPFLQLWIQFRESAQETSVEQNLESLLRQTGVEQYLPRLLRSASVKERLFAITTIGYLEEASAWDSLCPTLESNNVFLSLTAAEAMVKINAPEAMQWFVPLLPYRPEWPRSFVAKLLTQAGPEAATELMCEMVYDAPIDQIPRLVELLSFVEQDKARKVIQSILDNTWDESLILACLHVLSEFKNQGDREIARGFSEHPSWQVRVRAANLLKRIGIGDDEPLLIQMLQDENWWVRYRAAQALVALPSTDRERLKEIYDALDDPYAKDILHQSLGEKILGKKPA